MKLKKIILLFLCIPSIGLSQSISVIQTTEIPDANFEQALIDLGIDSNGLSGNIQNSDAAAVTGTLDISDKNIADLTGIEAFTEITSLYCISNQLSTINVTQNTKLLVLNCRSNQLTSLDLSGNLLLRDLNVQSNEISSIDVTNNTELTSLNLNSNQLTNLDVTQNTKLKTLSLQSNQLSSLDITQNMQLETIQCAINQITTLDVSQNTELINLYCRSNQITTVDVSQNINLLRITINNNQLTELDVSNNTLLTNLTCNNNDLTSLDISNNIALERLYVYNNELVTLNLKNGTNTMITNMDASSNPNLSCIQVDDTDYSTTNWTDIDAGAYFSEDCSFYIPDDNFEQALIDLGYDSGPLDDYMPIGNVTNITELDISNKNISDLTGIEQFISLEILSCQNNQISSLNLSQQASLVQLNCSVNTLTSLNVKNGNNGNFTLFDATSNFNLECIQVDDAIWSAANWTSIDPTSSFSKDCTLLGVFTSVPDDNFEQILIDLEYDDVLDDQVATANINTVTGLSLPNENIAELTGIEDFTALTTLICINNDLTDLDVSNNTLLQTLFCTGNQLSSLDISNNTELIHLQCSSNDLTSLDVSENTLLKSLHVDGNLLTTLDVSNNLDLTTLTCQNNELTTLNISANSSINTFYIHNNQLSSLNVKNGNNNNFSFFNASNNPNLTCIEVDDATYSTENWTDIDESTGFSEDCQYDDDGDGVPNEQEVTDGTDPENGCEYLVANQVIANVSNEWNDQDCDCDGIINADEISAGTSPLPSPPTGSSYQSFCAKVNPTIADLVVNGNAIQWYDIPDGGTPLNENSDLEDATSYFASQKVGECAESDRIEVYVTVTNSLEPTGLKVQYFCIDDNPTIADLSASGTNIKWYEMATGGAPLLTNIALSDGSYHASQTINGCESDRFEVEVMISNAEVPIGPTIQSFCLENDPTVEDLEATGTNIQWYDTYDAIEPLPSTAPLTDRIYAYIYGSQTIGSCESDRLQVLVDITTKAGSPIADSFQSFCYADNPTIADISISGTDIKWYDAFEGGNELEKNTSLANNTSYFASQTTNMCGESIRAEVIVTVDDPATPTGPNAQSFCVEEIPTIADLEVNGTNIQWYADEAGEFELEASTILESGQYYASAIAGDCESSHLKITVSVDSCEVTGLEQKEIENIVIYPTITTGGVTVELNKQHNDIIVQVFNVHGKKEEIIFQHSENRIHFNISGSWGIYFVVVQTSVNNRSTYRVLKK